MRICASYGAMNLGRTYDFDVARAIPSQFYTFDMMDTQEMASSLSIKQFVAITYRATQHLRLQIPLRIYLITCGDSLNQIYASADVPPLTPTARSDRPEQTVRAFLRETVPAVFMAELPPPQSMQARRSISNAWIAGSAARELAVKSSRGKACPRAGSQVCMRSKCNPAHDSPRVLQRRTSSPSARAPSIHRPGKGTPMHPLDT